MAWAMRIRQQWLARIGAAALLLAFALATIISAAHQAEYDANDHGPVLELAAQVADGADGSADTEAHEAGFCGADFLCHVQMGLPGGADGAQGPLWLAGAVRPDPGRLMTGQTIDVVTPPPLSARA